jgi:hypothetical protein
MTKKLLLALVLVAMSTSAFAAAPAPLWLVYRYHLSHDPDVDRVVETSIYRDGWFLERTLDRLNGTLTLRRCQASPERMLALGGILEQVKIGQLDPGSCLSETQLFANGLVSDLVIDWFGRSSRHNDWRVNEQLGGGGGFCPAEVGVTVAALNGFLAESACSTESVPQTIP